MNQDGPIVIAYDGSAAARAAIALAGVHLTKDREALVLAVYQPVESVRFIGAPDIVLPAGVDDEIQAAGRRLAEEGEGLAREAGFGATGYVAQMKESVWETIVDFADDRDASLILMGTHSRSGVKRVLLGSVASAVMHHAERPVAVVPEAFLDEAETD